MGILSLLKSNRNSFFFILVLVVLPFLASSFIVVLVLREEVLIEHLSVLQWCALYFCAAFTMALALTHTTFIALLGGYFLGWTSLLYMIPSYIFASVLGYALARFVDKGTFFDSISTIKGVQHIVFHLKKKESLIIFFCRISPVLPFAMTNALLSILHANLTRYVLAGSAGMLPRTVLFIWLGMQAKNIRQLIEHPGDNLPSKILFAVLLVFSVAGLFFIFNKVLKMPEPESQE